MFACDMPFHIPSSWQPTYTSLSSPPVPQPSMTYVQQLDSTPYNQTPSPPVVGAELSVAVPDAQQSSLEKTMHTYGGSQEDCLLVDFSMDDDVKRPRRGPFKDPADKAQTAQTRKDNACVRCKMQRTRVRNLSVVPVHCLSNARNSVFPIPLICAESASPAKRSQTLESLTFLAFATRFRMLDYSGKAMCRAWSGADDGSQWR